MIRIPTTTTPKKFESAVIFKMIRSISMYYIVCVILVDFVSNG